ncbi:hypothetical protein E3N88_07693 [Mikania micrantha]|uniref:Aminotransferase-like plant mobile domain-containing protein n=1 Tax=Mikania micrantha TaxID=192012 RepID=A0A5N6PF78_9ASTR|nr:hypothetical protein E3N88_07693 [Mikania micrantha]
MGFGGLLSLQVEGVPQRMGFYVVDMFDEVNMEIRVPCGNIKVDEESLHNLLGVPKDGVDLLSIDAKKVWTPGVTGWRKKYNKDYITPSDIVSRIIKNYDDVSLNFQLDFLVLFISTMVECYAHGKCKLDVLDYFSDDSDVGKINWCKYIISRLKDCKKGWERKATSPFKGGLTILTLMYVGSVKINGMNMDVRVPPIKFWDLDRLKGREHVEVASGRFGDGIQRMLTKSFEEKREIEKRIQFLYKKYIEDARLEVICSSYEEIYNSKLGLTDDDHGEGAGEGVEYDVRIDAISLNGDETVEVLLEQKEANVFDCKEAEHGVKQHDMPSYSLGLTQEWAETKEHATPGV